MCKYQVAIILHLRGSLRGKYCSYPLVKAVRVLLLRIDTVDLEEFLRTAKKTEGCLQTLRREEVEKVASASLKSESKKTLGQKVLSLGDKGRRKCCQEGGRNMFSKFPAKGEFHKNFRTGIHGSGKF